MLLNNSSRGRYVKFGSPFILVAFLLYLQHSGPSISYSRTAHRGNTKATLTVEKELAALRQEVAELRIAQSPRNAMSSTDITTQIKSIKMQLLQTRLDRVHDTREAKKRLIPLLEAEVRRFPQGGPPTIQSVDARNALRDAVSIKLAQDVIEARVTSELRALTYPSPPPANSSETYKRRRPTYSTALFDMFDKLGCSYNYNANGWWVWRGAHRTNVLVVLGTGHVEETALQYLVQRGYVVWGRRQDTCNDRVCREGISYLGFLADASSPAKPNASSLLFIHGHLRSWHQPDPLSDMLADSMQCLHKTKRYVPLGWWSQTAAHRIWGNTNSRFARDYNMAVGGSGPTKGDFLLGFCCGQFAVSRELIEQNSIGFYQQLYEARLELKITDFALEFYWHIMFGEEEYTKAYFGVPKECQKVQNISLPVTQYSRLGQWTNKERAEVTVVLGFREAADEAAMRYVAEVRAVFPAEVNIWVRNHAYACSEKEWQSSLHCDFHRGYLHFTNDQDRPDSDAYIFLKGKEVPTADFAQHALRRAKCATAAARYTPLHDTRHAQNSLEAKTTFLVGARDHGTKDFGLHRMDALQAYNGSEFVVPKATLANASFPLLQATYEHFLMKTVDPADSEAELDHYWHYFFGEEHLMAPFSCPA